MSRTTIQPNRTITALITIGSLVLVMLFILTGNDPLGLFNSTEPPMPNTDSSTDWWHVYFTDPSNINNPQVLEGSIAEQLIETIDVAEKSIHIAAFEFNLTPVAEALIAAKARGVEVLWITDDEYGLEVDDEPDHGQFELLSEARIKIRDDGRTALMHNKFIIFDSLTVWTGSTNLTENGIFRNNNNVIVIQSSRVAEMYEREFDEMWEGNFGPTSPSGLNRQATTVNGTPVQIYFAAEDEVISQLTPLLASAQESIHFMAFSFTHDALGEIILQRAQAGVEVQGIFETRGSETEFSELPKMFCTGLAVRQDGNPGTFHHKVIIIDERILVTGSMNFSENADNSNDENVLVINQPELAAAYLAEFERRWAEARTPDPADMNCR